MKMDLNRKIEVGESSIVLGSVINNMLNVGGKGPDYLNIMRLFFKIEDTEGGVVSFNDEDLKTLRACFDNPQLRLMPMVACAIEFLFWPGKLGKSDKELAKRLVPNPPPDLKIVNNDNDDSGNPSEVGKEN